MGAVRVTPQKIDTMKRLRASGTSYRQISREVGVSVETVMYYLCPKVRAWRRRREARPDRVARFERFVAQQKMMPPIKFHTDATALNTKDGIVLVNTGRRYNGSD